jgi:hypothetical protein
MGPLVVQLSTDRPSYSSPERPRLRAALVNASDRPLVVVGCLDGSWSDGARFPRYTFAVTRDGGAPDCEDWTECGTRNPLEREYIRRLLPGDTVDPFGPGFFRHLWLERVLFDVPGLYTVTLTYDADAAPERFLGWSGSPEMETGASLAREVSRIRATSQRVEFVVRGPGLAPGSLATRRPDEDELSLLE